MKRLNILVAVLLCFCITGCTYDADRIYTVCKYEDDVEYVYNANGEFYLHDKVEDTFTPAYPVGLQAKPAIFLNINEGDYNLVEDWPNKFTASKSDLEHYLYELVMHNYTTNVLYADWKSIVIEAYNEEHTLRIYYTTDKSLRIYASDYDTNPEALPYIIKR